MNAILNQKNYASKIIVLTSIISVGYAIWRYHIMGGVPWKDFPFFILNKGISLAGFILLIFNFSLGPLKNLGVKVSDGWLNSRQALGITGFLLVFVHVFMSFLIFKPEILEGFFEKNGTLTLFGGLSMLSGITGFISLWVYNISFQTFLKEDKTFITLITSRKVLLISMLFSLAHIFFMGFRGWMNPSSWHGGLPPISFAAFSFFVVGYAINLAGRK